jgi:peptidoglycan/LPS O-acetylase OafA/YrhL
VIVGALIPNMGAWVYRFAPSEMMMFGAGAVAYFIGAHLCPKIPRTATAIGIVSICCFIYLSFCDDESLKPIFAFFGITGTAYNLKLVNYPILLLMACAAPSLFYLTKQSSPDRLLGEMSYPMYISHIFVLRMIDAYLPPSWQAGNALYVLSVLAVSYGMVIFIITPIDRYRRRLSLRRDMDNGERAVLGIAARVESECLGSGVRIATDANIPRG